MSVEKKQIVVTGAAGYLGSACLFGLSQRGFRKLVAVDRRTPRCQLPDVRWVVGDVNDENTLDSVRALLDAEVESRDVWLHFAGLFPKAFTKRSEFIWDDFERDNVQGTRNVLRIASLRPATDVFFFPSTALLYTRQGGSTGGLDLYARSKAEAENLLRDKSKVRHVIWRFPRVVGVRTIELPEERIALPAIRFLRQRLMALREQESLPDDIVSEFLIRSLEDPTNPMLNVSNSNYVRSYMHLTRLVDDIISLVVDSGHLVGVGGPSIWPGISLEGIARIVEEEMRISGVDIGVNAVPSHEESVIEMCDRDARRQALESEASESVIRQTVREYLVIATRV